MLTSAPFASPTPASRDAGVTPRHTSPSNSLSNPVGEGRGEANASLLPWQRLDATWQTLPESLASGLDGLAQRLVRRCLIEAVGKRFALRRRLEPESLRLWETRPHLAQYARKRRFYSNLLSRYGLEEFRRLLFNEVVVVVEVLETPPGKLGLEEWAALLELQCQRIGELYAHLRGRIGAQAQQEVQWAFQRVPGCQTHE